MVRPFISFKKIEFRGSSPLRGEEFYDVASILITVKKLKALDTSQFEIDVENDFKDKEEFICTCKDCANTRIPNGLPPRCNFVKSLKAFIKLKRFKK